MGFYVLTIGFGEGVHFAFGTIIYYFLEVGKGKRKTADYYTAVSLLQFIYLLSSPFIQPSAMTFLTYLINLIRGILLSVIMIRM